jgi:hypothetical protein
MHRPTSRCFVVFAFFGVFEYFCWEFRFLRERKHEAPPYQRSDMDISGGRLEDDG